jgi:hypothetical protein
MEVSLRNKLRGWVMPQEDIPSMLKVIEAKIASSEIDVHQRDALVRLLSILEEDLSVSLDADADARRSKQRGQDADASSCHA